MVVPRTTVKLAAVWTVKP